MNPLPPRHSRPLIALTMAVLAVPAWAQSTGRATVGQGLHATHCSSCHSTVTAHRSQIWNNNAYADVPFATAYTDIELAINSVSAMSSLSSLRSLTVQQRSDIAAYLADTPKVNATGLDNATNPSSLAFAAAAQGSSVNKTITINHSVATTDSLRVVSVALNSSSTRFSHTGSNCTSSTANINPTGSCNFNVSYVATNSTPESRTLTITLSQNGATFTRSIAMTGTISGVTPPPTPAPPTPAPAPADSGGGGATGWLWQLGLSLGTAVLWLRRRHLAQHAA